MSHEHDLDGLFCQSCGKPMLHLGEHGTLTAGRQATEYCNDCYRDGQFTEPEISKIQMIGRAADFLVKERCLSRPLAESLAASFVPALRRWHAGLGT